MGMRLKIVGTLTATFAGSLPNYIIVCSYFIFYSSFTLRYASFFGIYKKPEHVQDALEYGIVGVAHWSLVLWSLAV